MVDRCFLCNSASLDLLYKTKDRHYGIAGEYTMVECTECQLVFLNPMYTDTELAALYPEDYYAYRDNTKQSPFKEGLKRKLGFPVGTKDPQFRSPGKVLDLGCGSGWFLAAMKARGWDARGVELNEGAARVAVTNGLEVFCGTLEAAAFPETHFDYIRANHSFEHMTRPHETLDEIYRILKADGLLMIGVPNRNSWNARLFGKYWWYLGAPVHPFNYSVSTLSRLLEQHGFGIKNVTFNSDFSGVLGSLQIWMNRRTGRRSTEGSWFNNYPLRLLAQWFAKTADCLKKGDAIEITATKFGELSGRARELSLDSSR